MASRDFPAGLTYGEIEKQDPREVAIATVLGALRDFPDLLIVWDVFANTLITPRSYSFRGDSIQVNILQRGKP